MDVEKENVIKNKNEAIKMLNNYLDTCISIDSKHLKKANLISYWLKDYIRYIENEETFSCEKLKKYSRGDIIKVNLGFNIGNEEGGLHYCVVLDVINAKKYSTLTVVPLTSQKNNKNIPNSAILLGTEIYDKLSIKNKTLKENAIKKSKEYMAELKLISTFVSGFSIINNFATLNLFPTKAFDSSVMNFLSHRSDNNSLIPTLISFLDGFNNIFAN